MSGTSLLPKPDSDEQIVRFFCGETSLQEERRLLAWVRQSERHRAWLTTWRRIYLLSLTLCRAIGSSAGMQWNRQLQPPIGSDALPPRKKMPTGRRLMRYAAMIALAVIGCSALFCSMREGHPAAPETVPAEERIEFAVSFGSPASTSLPDGSRIWVNAGSRISYAPDYNDTQREIRLEGEAYFDVTTDPNKPFVVRARDISIVATGTAFNVSAYADDLSVTTTLVHGRVTINGGSIPEPIEVAPNQTVEYFIGENGRASMARSLEESNLTPATRNISVIAHVPAIKLENNPAIYTSWKEEQWVIEGERLESLMHKIERRYNVSVYFTDEEIKGYRFNGSFAGETIDETLRIIHRTLPIDYKIDKGIVLLFLNKNLKKTFDSAAVHNSGAEIR